MQTIVRGLEAFLAVFFSAFFAQAIVAGEPLDPLTRDGQSRIATAAFAAVLLAARQWTAARKTNGAAQ